MHDTFMRFLGWLLGSEETLVIEDPQLKFTAPWARDTPLWLALGCVALAAIVVLFYFRYQRNRRRSTRVVMTVLRASVLCLLLVLLGKPVLEYTETSRPRPALWLVFDGTDSMTLGEQADQQEELAKAVGLEGNDAARQEDGSEAKSGSPGEDRMKPALQASSAEHSRMDYVQALLRMKEGNLLQKLREKFDIEAFVFDGPKAVRQIGLCEPGKRGIDGEYVARQLTTKGQVTAIGAALDDLARRERKANLAGVVLFSDFDENCDNPPPLEAAKRLHAKVYTVGVGATSAIDLAVDEVRTDPKAKKDEQSTVTLLLKHNGLRGKRVHVRLSEESISGAGGSRGRRELIGDKPDVELTDDRQAVVFTYTPQAAGWYWLVAQVDRLPGERITDNNEGRCTVLVLDDYFRLLFVEYEPTWEWRFIKEVFHRDPLVGMKGFRTFLYSSDPRVRKVNEMFLPGMTSERKEFLSHDVIFLGDMPGRTLSRPFCEMVKEFVKDFGGGLVILSGPRWGPGELAGTPLGDLLPVKVEPGQRIDDRQPFNLRLTPMAAEYPFMQLGSAEHPEETQRAWDNMGPLPWYQPVLRVHPQATVLAEHPAVTCKQSEGGEEKQPLIVVRPYGKGEVIYLGFNETWRLRRKFGERYYRHFWGQMIQRLALNHALGSEKRFVVRTDRAHYEAGAEVTVTAEALDANFKVRSAKGAPLQKLEGKLVLPVQGKAGGASSRPLSLTLVKEGVFEARFVAEDIGEHRVSVTDPETSREVDWRFPVIRLSVERQQVVRNLELQRKLASTTSGKTFELKDAQSLVEHLPANRETKIDYPTRPLGSTWLYFGLVSGLLLSEWLVRKWVNLP